MKRTAHRAARDLVGALRRQAARVGAETPSVRGADWRIAVVATVNAGANTVVTEDGVEVRRWESYTAPAVGDIIGITQSGGGSWGTWGRWATGPGILATQTGTALLSWTNQSFATTTVTFPRAFPVAPRVFTNISANGTEVARWVSRAYNITTSSFTCYIAAPAVTNTTGTNMPVQWEATIL
ncbi:hypothetical protein [Streptomyces sp. bgisy029]|uniref:hypothetical protein n=1 Tax=Streptomyces sp. bgisy029 TaxID=3413771 RepID=UPI003D72F0E3